MGNKAFCNIISKNEHKFVFANINLQRDAIWQVVINERIAWMAFGICRKDIVITNNYKFTACSIVKGYEHGCFLISSNGFIWNNNVNDENNKKLEKPIPIIFLKGDIINLKYNSEQEELEISFQNFNFTLTKVSCPDKTMLAPCAIFMNYGDSVSFLKA